MTALGVAVDSAPGTWRMRAGFARACTRPECADSFVIDARSALDAARAARPRPGTPSALATDMPNDHYQLGELLGRGGMGQVHIARHRSGREVAVKRVRNTL